MMEERKPGVPLDVATAEFDTGTAPPEPTVMQKLEQLLNVLIQLDPQAMEILLRPTARCTPLLSHHTLCTLDRVPINSTGNTELPPVTTLSLLGILNGLRAQATDPILVPRRADAGGGQVPLIDVVLMQPPAAQAPSQA